MINFSVLTDGSSPHEMTVKAQNPLKKEKGTLPSAEYHTIKRAVQASRTAARAEA